MQRGKPEQDGRLGFITRLQYEGSRIYILELEINIALWVWGALFITDVRSVLNCLELYIFKGAGARAAARNHEGVRLRCGKVRAHPLDPDKRSPAGNVAEE